MISKMKCLQLSSNVEENDVVLKCWQPSFPPKTTSVMCYTVKFSYETECVVVDVNKNDTQTKEITGIIIVL